MQRKTIAVILFLLLHVAPCIAQSSGSGFEPKVKPELHIERASGSIDIDGKLNDPGWQGAAVATGFTEIQPGDEVKPLVRTEVLVTYDDTYLYLGFRAYDDPDAVRATLQNRDQIFQDDFVGIILDTYGNATQAYEIFANPLGVQADLLRTRQGEDPGFDMVYLSAGRITNSGYQVEMAIPFSSLRFPDRPKQVWRITFARNHPRASRHIYSWATIDRDNACWMCQSGTLIGLENLETGHSLDVLPAVVGSQVGALEDPDDPTSAYDNGRIHFQPSLTLRYDLTSSMALEAAINPDFSQVASDAAQIDVNQTFALSYPERRPFFQEGSELLDTWIEMVYTRSINDPIAAVKATRRGRMSLVYLGAVDQHTPILLPFEERSEIVRAGQSVSNILRVQRSFGTSSFIGGMISDRRLQAGGAGTEAGIDIGYQFHKNYRVEGQLVLSRTIEPASDTLSMQIDTDTFARGTYTSALDGERYWGHGAYFSLERRARWWDFDLTYRGYSPTFRTVNGFVRRNNFRAFSMEQGLNFHPDWKLVDAFFPSIQLSREINFAGERKQDVIQPEFFLRLIGQTGIYANYTFKREAFHGVMFEGLQSWFINVNSRFSQLLSGGFYISGGDAIRREETPELGRQLDFGLWATIKPLQRLVIEPSFNYARLTDLVTGDEFYSGYITRTRINFQFSRELSLRLIVQYNDFNEQFDIEPLLSYELNPYSVFYLGSTLDYGTFDAPYGLMPTERQFFFKFQYLFRI